MDDQVEMHPSPLPNNGKTRWLTNLDLFGELLEVKWLSLYFFIFSFKKLLYNFFNLVVFTFIGRSQMPTSFETSKSCNGKWGVFHNHTFYCLELPYDQAKVIINNLMEYNAKPPMINNELRIRLSSLGWRVLSSWL